MLGLFHRQTDRRCKAVLKFKQDLNLTDCDMLSDITDMYPLQLQPFCITVDFDSLEDGQVTIRERDTTQQERVSIDRLEQVLSEKLGF